MHRGKIMGLRPSGGKLFYSILFILSVTGISAQTGKNDLDYGLSFASHEVTKDQRTSLNLNVAAPFTFEQDFEIRFDLSFRRLQNAYGYVVRIIANDSLNIDLVCSPEHSDFFDLSLVVNNTTSKIHYDFADVDLKARQWTPIRIGFSYKKNRITFSWCGKEKTQDFPMGNVRAFRFYFGANAFGKFNTTDVPPMILRNIEIINMNRPVLKWELKKHNVNEVYDSLQGLVATVKNASWLIDEHTQWTHLTDFVIGKYPSVAFNSSAGILYALDKSAIYEFNIHTGKKETRKFREGNPVYTDANQLVYVDETKQLINYDLYTRKFSAFDFHHSRWGNNDTRYNEPNYWHNNKFYNPTDSSLYTFGGYGMFSYKGNFSRYDAPHHQWVNVSTTVSIPPRYLGAAGLNTGKSQAYIFGGYGSVSGKQELSPQSFYDLYTFDLKSHQVKKIWALQPPPSSEDIVFSNSLVVNEKEDCFYVLSFPKNKYESHIKLRKYSLSRPESSVLADSIPFHFHDENSFSDLFLSRPTKQLIAVTTYREGTQYKVDVYSINYPPLRAEDVLQSAPAGNSKAAFYFILPGMVALLVLYLSYAGLRKKGKTKNQPPVLSGVEKEEGMTPDNLKDADVARSLHGNKLSSTINLFGGFQVFDKTGNDVTGKLTMTLKELFGMILLYSIKFENGISTEVLQEYLWPDKDQISARNNRNVNIKKLRTFLEQIGDISIENNNSYLRLVIHEDVFCDYQMVYRILNTDSTVMEENKKIEFLLKYVKRGSLLPNLQAAWVDNFKSDISNKIIDVLLEHSQKLDFNKDDKILLEIADSIFNYDCINQEALVIKCSILNKKGKYSLAKTSYDHFIKEYKNLYSENYPKTFDEVIS
jgi:DNA-binding SARP family transcriptional activator